MGYINLLVDTFAGLGSKTLSVAVPRTATVAEAWQLLERRLPAAIHGTRLILTTVSNRQLCNDNDCDGGASSSSSSRALLEYLSSADDDFVAARLSVPVLGGKGGFGSQLRAAGGRMSKKKRNNEGEESGSSRNLDGRRIRTVTEAKALAEYLAIKPEMERQEKEKRKQRWQHIVDMTEMREAEIKRGARGKLDGKWVEDKEDAAERTRDAVVAALKTRSYRDPLLETSSALLTAPATNGGGIGALVEEADMAGGNSDASTSSSERPKGPTNRKPVFAGFDDDEFMSSDDE